MSGHSYRNTRQDIDNHLDAMVIKLIGLATVIAIGGGIVGGLVARWFLT